MSFGNFAFPSQWTDTDVASFVQIVAQNVGDDQNNLPSEGELQKWPDTPRAVLQRYMVDKGWNSPRKIKDASNADDGKVNREPLQPRFIINGEERFLSQVAFVTDTDGNKLRALYKEYEFAISGEISVRCSGALYSLVQNVTGFVQCFRSVASRGSSYCSMCSESPMSYGEMYEMYRTAKNGYINKLDVYVASVILDGKERVEKRKEELLQKATIAENEIVGALQRLKTSEDNAVGRLRQRMQEADTTYGNLEFEAYNSLSQRMGEMGSPVVSFAPVDV